MTGYFNNLAIRTVSRGNLVEPRVASVFEPQGALVSTVETGARSLATDFTDERKADSATTPISSNAPAAFSRNQTPAAVEPVSTVTTVATESFVEPTSRVDEPEFHAAEAPLAALKPEPTSVKPGQLGQWLARRNLFPPAIPSRRMRHQPLSSKWFQTSM